MAEKAIGEFERPGSIRLEEYIAGLKAEFADTTDDDVRRGIKAELDRVSRARSTAVAPSDRETA